MINYMAILVKCEKCGEEYPEGVYSKECPHEPLFETETTTDATSWTIMELKE